MLSDTTLRVVSTLWRDMLSGATGPLLILERGRSWKDGRYITSFTAVVRCGSGEQRELGMVKVLQRGADRSSPPRSPQPRLDDNFCSLGQSVDYYERLDALGPSMSSAVLKLLRDIAFDESVDEAFKNEDGRTASLLRSPEAVTAYDHARARYRTTVPVSKRAVPSAGQGRTMLRFAHRLWGHDSSEQCLCFEFFPEIDELGRVCVLAGPNATGKTRLLRALSKSAGGMREDETVDYVFDAEVCRVLVVTYCTLDAEIQGFRHWKTRYHNGVGYHHCGFENRAGGEPDIDLTLRRACQQVVEFGDAEGRLWRELVGECDFLADEPVIQRMLDSIEFSSDGLMRLSAGQKVIFLFLSQVIHAIRRNSLLLIDEPENHLHPEGLSFILRALRRLLREYDSLAIISTHSPLVLQETPGKGVTLIQRDGASISSFPYPGESFGASLNEIMTNAFGLSEHARNYAKYLKDELEGHSTRRVEAVLKTDEISTAVISRLEKAREERG